MNRIDSQSKVIPEGQRQKILFPKIKQYYYKGYDYDTTLSLITKFNLKFCIPALPEVEIRRMLHYFYYRTKILADSNYKCVKCRDTATQVDHIIPVALNGSDTIENLQPLCKSCHKQKTEQDRIQIKKSR